MTRVRAERGDARRGLYAYRHHAALLKVSAKGSLLDPFLVVVQAKTPVYEQRLGTLPAAQRLYLVRRAPNPTEASGERDTETMPRQRASL